MSHLRLLLIAGFLLLNVGLYAQQSQTVSLSLKNASLETVLTQIKSQTGISFFYNKDIIKTAGKVTIQASKQDLMTTLDLCFKNTPITYSVFGNIIVLTNKNSKKNDDGVPDANEAFFSQISVHGFVFNDRGERLNGANAIIKRNRQGTTTNANGEFSFSNVRTNDTLHISFIGYDFQDLPVALQTEFNVQLKETKNELDAVEVQAYGVTTKRLSIGEINQVNAKDIERQPVSNPMLALKSLVPGALITPTSGYSNAPVKVEIRGRNSIDPLAPSDPLYIIDGVPLIQSNIGLQQSSYQYGSTGLQQAGISFSGGQSPFASLNPNDIESITVLKDAAATAMYGSRAGNGVIIITSKKGKAGRTRFDISGSKMVQQVIGHYDMLNTSQYLQMRREALSNDGLVPSLGNAPDLTLWDTTRNIDWQKELWKMARSSSVRASLSGGSQMTTFRISGAYSSASDVSPLANLNTNKSANISFNFNHRSIDQKLSVDFAALYGYNKTDQIANGGASTYAPSLPPIFDKSDKLNYADWNAANLGYSFPFSGLLEPSVANTYLLNTSLRVGYQILNGLKVSVTAGYNLGLNNNSTTTTIASQNPIFNPSGTVFFGDSKTDGWNITPQLDYNRHIGKGKLSILAGGNLNSTVANGITTLAFGFTSDQLARSVNNAMTVSSLQNYAQSKYVDFHASLNYNWEDKYIIEVSGNRDGSSNFGPGRQFGTFGVAGAAWIASEEQWIKKAIPSWISLVKFKVSYGTTGLYPNVAYQYLSQWANTNLGGSEPLYSYNGIVPQVPIHAVNQDYRWETNRESNAAIDLGFLNDRFNLHAAVYRKRSDNQLAMLPTPLFTGFGSVQGNSRANVQNTGLEIVLNTRLIETNNFAWRATFNYSHNTNKLLAFPGIEYTSYYYTQKVGESLNNVYLLHYTGVDPQTGQRSYEDFDKNGVIVRGSGPPGKPGDDRGVTIDMNPRFESSVINQITCKNFTLSLQLSYRNMISAVPFYNSGGTFNNNVPLFVFNDHWKKPGDISSNPRFTTVSGTSDGYFTNSDGAYTDGSYLRLQNVALRYALPDRQARKIGMQGVSFLISMENTYTLSRYPGIDPELPFGSQPQPKIFNGQVSLTF